MKHIQTLDLMDSIYLLETCAPRFKQLNISPFLFHDQNNYIEFIQFKFITYITRKKKKKKKWEKFIEI